jgi:hypothetical protein
MWNVNIQQSEIALGIEKYAQGARFNVNGENILFISQEG